MCSPITIRPGASPQALRNIRGSVNEQAIELNTQSNSVARSRLVPKHDWREQIRTAFRDPMPLLRFLELDAEGASRAGGPFPMLVPLAFALRMRRGDWNDPLLRQVLPDPDESVDRPGFGTDPVGDLASRQAPSVLHKYHGRALLTVTGACAVHCRYCFRQHFPYAGATVSGQRWQEALDYLAGHQTVSEVILSGGDPLMLSTDRLTRLTADLAGIGHLRRLRIHTRLPVILPDRVSPNLTAWLSSLPWPTTVVIHANHPAEFDSEVDDALARLRSTGVHLLNQAVLLRGVNDQTSILASLMERGFQAGVLPYYLHQLDRVAGSARFEVSPAQAQCLMDALRARLPGYLVPKLVVETAGEHSKTPLT